MGTARGKAAKEIIDSGSDEKFTPAICVAEVYAKSLKSEGAEMAEMRRNFIRDRSAVAPLTEEIAVAAAKIDVERKKVVHRWGLADSTVLATGRELSARVVTGDEHFRGLSDVMVI